MSEHEIEGLTYGEFRQRFGFFPEGPGHEWDNKTAQEQYDTLAKELAAAQERERELVDLIREETMTHADQILNITCRVRRVAVKREPRSGG